MQTLSESYRAYWHCGWMPPERHTGPVVDGVRRSGVRLRDEVPHAPETCPGYTTRLPDVVEGLRAQLWLDKGDLRGRYEDATPTPRLIDALEILAASEGEVQAHRLRRGKGG